MDPIREAEVRAAALKLKLQRKGLVPNPRKWWGWEPYPKQQALLDGDFEEAFYGGAVAGAKSTLLLMAASKYVDYGNYRALILRKTTNALKAARGLIELSKTFFSGTGARYNEKEMLWKFPSGATLQFGFLDHDGDLDRYQGGGYTFVGFDELSQFTQYQYSYLFSRLRKDLESTEIPLRIYSTSNPDPKAMWIYNHFIKDAIESGPYCKFKKHSSYIAGRTLSWHSVFVPAYLEDNICLDREAYLLSLAHLADFDEVTIKRLLGGDWLVRPEGDIYKIRECWHLVTRSAFAAIVGVPTIPNHWRLGMGLDWGATKESLAGGVWVAKAAANIVNRNPLLKDAKFIYREQTWEGKIPDVVYEDIVKLEIPYQETSRRFDFRIMSHDALTVRQIFNQTYRMPFIQSVHQVAAGIEVIQNALRIVDLDRPHPFNIGVMGHPNLYLLVDDDQARRFENPDFSDTARPYLISPATHEGGLLGLREDMPGYSWDKDGKPIHDRRGLLDALRMIGWRFFPSTAGKTQAEREDETLPLDLRMDMINQASNLQELNSLMRDRQMQLSIQKFINSKVAEFNSAKGKGGFPPYKQNPFSRLRG